VGEVFEGRQGVRNTAAADVEQIAPSKIHRHGVGLVSQTHSHIRGGESREPPERYTGCSTSRAWVGGGAGEEPWGTDTLSAQHTHIREGQAALKGTERRRHHTDGDGWVRIDV